LLAQGSILLERIAAREPVIARAIEPKTQAEKEKLDFGLAKLADEDPTFRTGEDPETGQTIIRGMGELHLDIMADRLRREYGVDAHVGQPQVVYRETLAKAAEAEARFERESRMRRCSAGRVRVSPRPRGSGNHMSLALAKVESLSGAPRIPEPPRAILDAHWRAPLRPCVPVRRAILSGASRWAVIGIEYRPDAPPPPASAPAVGEALRQARARRARACLSPS